MSTNITNMHRIQNLNNFYQRLKAEGIYSTSGFIKLLIGWIGQNDLTQKFNTDTPGIYDFQNITGLTLETIETDITTIQDEENGNSVIYKYFNLTNSNKVRRLGGDDLPIEFNPTLQFSKYEVVYYNNKYYYKNIDENIIQWDGVNPVSLIFGQYVFYSNKIYKVVSDVTLELAGDFDGVEFTQVTEENFLNDGIDSNSNKYFEATAVYEHRFDDGSGTVVSNYWQQIPVSWTDEDMLFSKSFDIYIQVDFSVNNDNNPSLNIIQPEYLKYNFISLVSNFIYNNVDDYEPFDVNYNTNNNGDISEQGYFYYASFNERTLTENSNEKIIIILSF